MEFVLEPLVDCACHTGEGPLYHPEEQSIYWTDIPQGRLFCYRLATGHHEAFEIGRPVGGFTLQEDGKFLLFMDQGAIAYWSPGGTLDYLIEDISEEAGTRFNDVMTDTEGRVYCGTMPTESRAGRLYRLNQEGTITKVLDGIGCSNGMGLTPDRKFLYYTDTSARTIYRFVYDKTTGSLARQRSFIVAEQGGGYPDGMTVDAAGNIWSARWEGSCLVGYTPQGKELARVPFPVKKVSSVTFGGPNYDQMFVTTAGGHQKETEGALAGALFRLTIPGITGVPEHLSCVGL
jgi:D-xylono/L-arabinono-1,4-lactonase